MPHPELGWSIRAGGVNGQFRANSAGLRADREYSSLPSISRVRVAAFGDSFTHGDEVAQQDTWQAALERADPELEVLNFGVPGYGPGQAYLRYQQLGRRFGPDIVLIGFMSENVHRAVNRFRPFYTRAGGIPFSKPRFVLEGQQLRLIPNPLRDAEDYQALLADPESVLRRLSVNDPHYGDRYYAPWFDWSPTVRLITVARATLGSRQGDEEVFVGGAYNEATERFRSPPRSWRRSRPRYQRTVESRSSSSSRTAPTSPAGDSGGQRSINRSSSASLWKDAIRGPL